MRRGVTLGIGCAVNRDKPRMHGMGGPASTGARGHEITVNVHLSGHLGHRARHGRHILNPEADGGQARASEHAASKAGSIRNTAFADNILTFMILP